MQIVIKKSKKWISMTIALNGAHTYVGDICILNTNDF